MLGTGCFATFLAVRRLFFHITPTVSWYPITVAALSVPVYVARSAYERASGLHTANVTLISQSVDSRNHAVASLGVLGGLISVSVLHVTVLDTLIGLAVALIILYSAIRLAIGVVRSSRIGQAPELSRYPLWLGDRLESRDRTPLIGPRAM